MTMRNLYELEYDHEESLGVRIWSWRIFRCSNMIMKNLYELEYDEEESLGVRIW